MRRGRMEEEGWEEKKRVDNGYDDADYDDDGQEELGYASEVVAAGAAAAVVLRERQKAEAAEVEGEEVER